MGGKTDVLLRLTRGNRGWAAQITSYREKSRMLKTFNVIIEWYWNGTAQNHEMYHSDPNLRVTQIIRQALNVVRCKLVLIQQHMVVTWTRCTLKQIYGAAEIKNFSPRKSDDEISSYYKFLNSVNCCEKWDKERGVRWDQLDWGGSSRSCEGGRYLYQ